MFIDCEYECEKKEKYSFFKLITIIIGITHSLYSSKLTLTIVL